MQHELASRERAPETALEQGPLLRVPLHLGGEELEVVAPDLLRPVHGGVDVGEQDLRVAPVFRVESDAEAGGEEQLAFLDEEGGLEDREDLPRHHADAGRIPHSGQKEKELVSSQPRHGVLSAKSTPEAPADLHQQLVPGRVPQRVVDMLEVVQVQKHDRDLLAPPPGPLDGQLEAVVEERPVGKAGQRVVMRPLPAPLLRQLPVGDVDEAAVHDGRRAGLLDNAFVQENPDGGVVAAPHPHLLVDGDVLRAQTLESGLPLGGVHEELGGSQPPDLTWRWVAEQAGERLVAFQDVPVGGHPVHAGQTPFEQEPVPTLRRPHGRFRRLALDGHGELGGDEREEIPVGVLESDSLRIALNDDDPDRLLGRPERDAEPVDRGSADELDFPLANELLEDLRRGQDRLAGPKNVIGETPPQGLGRGRSVVFVHEVREADPVALAVVESDVEVPGRHQLADDRVKRPEELLEARGLVCRLGNPVSRLLQPFGALPLGDVPKAPDPPRGAPLQVLGPREALEDPAVAKREDVHALRLGIRIELPDLFEKDVRVRELLEHEREHPVVVECVCRTCEGIRHISTNRWL